MNLAYPRDWPCRICLTQIPKGQLYKDVCYSCGIRIGRRYAAQLADEANQERWKAEAERFRRAKEQEAKNSAREAAARPPSSERPSQQGSVVYYVQDGEHIKIGYSTKFVSRLSQLRIPRDGVLAIEPGGREVESDRHAQFAHLRVGRWEKFTAADELTAHIAALVETHGIPEWINPPKKNRYKYSSEVTVRRVDPKAG